MNRLLHIFWDVSMALQHDGLTELLKKNKAPLPHQLNPGEMLLFVNKRKDKFKVIAGTSETESNGVLAYYKTRGRPIDVQALKYIPEAFNGQRIEYNSALKRTLEERLNKKEVKSNGALRLLRKSHSENRNSHV